jgi:hypothetical protein
MFRFNQRGEFVGSDVQCMPKLIGVGLYGCIQGFASSMIINKNVNDRPACIFLLFYPHDEVLVTQKPSYDVKRMSWTDDYVRPWWEHWLFFGKKMMFKKILFIILDHCCVVLPTKKSPDHRLANLKVGSVFSRGGSSARLKFAAIERLISWINWMSFTRLNDRPACIFLLFLLD